MKSRDIFELLYKILMVSALMYIGYELNSIKKLTVENEREINYVTSKLDYVTSDINITKISN